MIAKQYVHTDCSPGSRLGPFWWLGDTSNHGKWQAAHHLIFLFSSIHGSILFGFWDTDDVNYLESRMFWPFLDVIRLHWSVCSTSSICVSCYCCHWVSIKCVMTLPFGVRWLLCVKKWWNPVFDFTLVCVDTLTSIIWFDIGSCL